MQLQDSSWLFIHWLHHTSYRTWILLECGMQPIGFPFANNHLNNYTKNTGFTQEHWGKKLCPRPSKMKIHQPQLISMDTLTLDWSHDDLNWDLFQAAIPGHLVSVSKGLPAKLWGCRSNIAPPIFFQVLLLFFWKQIADTAKRILCL